MKTIILNCSPNYKKGNTNIFINEFTKHITSEYEVKCIAKENYEELAKYIKNFDSIILAMPMYIHAMPGIAMKFIEHIKPSKHNENKSIGFLIQYGFQEGCQSDYIVKYFEYLAKELNLNYLGTVIKPGAAGTNIKPRFMSRKLFKVLNNLGIQYDKTGTFDNNIILEMSKPYKLEGFNLKYLNFVCKVGIESFGLNAMLKKNNALDKKFDKPYI